MTTTNKTTSKKSNTKTNQKEGATMANDKMERNAKPAKKSPSEKFVEVVNIRMPKAIRQIQAVTALADKSKYNYTDEQAAKIKEALQAALNDLIDKFDCGEKVENTVFKL
ncbi:hypothetical protein [Endozoicomonas sp. SESOKO1]|uniref:hypothetical protein n=1 Tax=Endozoicomonas sp. SESOKO1 TaxID=2828742 RepID=UPI002148FD43|nr:hypothetical protein [Endozoicomonas sp. SESOKO1]